MSTARALLLDPFALPFMARALAEAVLLGVLAGVTGVLVVLRRLAFAAEALTHTVFPGVVIGFAVGATSGVVPGAVVAGALSAVLFTVLARHRLVTEDASLAILLTGFFAVGVAVVSRRAAYTTDLTTFLFGRILTVDAAQVGQTAAVATAVLLVLAGLRKELLLRAFDPGAAAAMGYPTGRLDLAVNLLVAAVVVAGVRAVGTVLVVALLVIPAAAARLVTDRVTVMLWLAPLVGALGGWLGLVVSFEASVGYGVRLASGATIVLAQAACYALAAGVALAVRYRSSRPRGTPALAPVPAAPPPGGPR